MAAGQTGLALRYSAGASAATRKLELDGSVLIANQTFAKTATWNTWATISLSANLAAGTHTLKVWYDAAAGSSRFLNLDNLTVTSQAPVVPPANTAPPAITGVAQVGSTLTTTTGTWTGSPTSFSYEWSRCNGSCAPITNPTNTYVPVAADIGATIAATVTATNAAGPGTAATSAPTAAVVAAPPPAVPTNTGLPTIGGVAQVGSTLTASNGTWTGSPTSFTYQWSRCNGTCTPVASSTNTYVPVAADVGSTIAAAVTATNTIGPSLPATSAATAAVTTAPTSQRIAAGSSTTNLQTESVFTGAQNPPYICCWSAQDQYVTFSFTVAAGQTTLALRYSAGSGAATRKVELDGSVLVANQSFPATASWNTWGSVSLAANLSAGSHTLKIWFDAAAGSNRYMNLDNLTVTSVGPPPPPPPVPTNTSPPAITGTPQVGRTLTTTNGTWTDSPTSFAYQWSKCNGSCTPVGTSTSTYVPVDGDVGSTVTVTDTVAVTATNAGGPSSPAASSPTTTVTSAPANLVIGAGASATNLPTEAIFTGAQNPPYICCWNQQGQFVTFTFNTPSGATTLALRYSAAIGQATRKLELDGSVLVANQAFPATANWNTWSTVTVSPVLSAGTHSLKVWFDATAGSSQWLNLDNLTVPGGTATPAPTNTGLPTITGTAQVGITLTTTNGTWTGNPTSFAYQWARCNGACTPITNFGNTYVPVAADIGSTAADIGSTVAVAVTATNAGGPSSPTTSAPTASVVAGGSATIAVALGYADSTAGLSPWSGSANTFFIGEPAQCCSTHGPNNGSPTYDAGAIEVTNTSAASIVVNAVTADIPSQSGPVTYSLWGGGGSTRLPQTIPAGGHLVLTMTSGFNFDTSDGYGEACHFNTGGIPVVQVAVDGALTDYQDTHQILNADGNDKSGCPGAVSEEVAFTTVLPGAQPPAAPVNDVAPSLTGVATQGRVMSGIPGAWNASPPPSLVGQWLQCDGSGAGCTPIGGATSQTYRPAAADVGHTLRYEVTASNASGTLAVASAPSALVQAGPAVVQLGNTSTGYRSIFVVTSNELSSRFTASAGGTTTDFTFYVRGAGSSQVFTPKIYSVVGGNKGALLGIGSPINVPRGADAQWYVSTLPGLALTAGAQYILALAPAGAYNGSYLGSENDGTLSVFVDYAP